MSSLKKTESSSIKSILKGEQYKVEPKFLHRMLEDGMIQHKCSKETALIFEDEGVSKRFTTYEELNQNANQIANAILDTIKIKALTANSEGDWIIAVCMKPSDILIATLLAIWKSGASYLPIDVEFPQNRIEHIMNEAKPVMVIHDDSYENARFFSPRVAIKFGDIQFEASNMDNENIHDEKMLTKGDPSTKALTLYTSGSSGVSKGVRIRHHTFSHRIMWQLKFYPFAESEKNCVSKTALTFADHVAEMWCPLISGRTLIVVPKNVVKNPEQLVSILEDYKIERLLGVPTLLRSVLMYMNIATGNKSKSKLSNLKMWISSGEPLTMQLAQEFFDYFKNGDHILVNIYGCTEVNCDASVYEISSRNQLTSFDRIPIGLPLPNTIIYVFDKDMQPADEGEVGEIYVAGVNVTDGYINGRDAGAFLANPLELNKPYDRMYRTGDFGVVKNGVLFCEGRRDAQIKIRGHRIDISEIEKNVNELSYVAKSAILVYHAMLVDQALVAFIILNKQTEKLPAEVETDLKTRLAPYMVPQVLIVPKFPYLPNGKIDRQELLRTYEVISAKNKQEFKMVLDFKNVPQEKLAMAEQVFEIVGQTLGTELRTKVSTEANFFALGGNSLNSIYTVTQLRQRGFYISITDFLQARNLGEVLDMITKSKPAIDELKMVTDMKLIKEPLDELERKQCIQLLALSFYNKADLDQFLPNLKLENYVEVVDSLYNGAMTQGFSFKVKNERGEIIGVSFNFDVEDEPEVDSANPLAVTFEFLESIEKPIISKKLKPSKGEILHGLMMGTHGCLTAKDNIGVIAFMESEIIKMATEKGFKGIITTNTNPLTQQFGESVFGYRTITEILANTFVDKKGNRPFSKAPDTQKAITMYKNLK